MRHLVKIIRRWLLTGLLTWVPIFLTAFVLFKVFQTLDSWAGDLSQRLFGQKIPGLGIAILITATLLIGAAVSNYLGQRLFKLFDVVISRIPAVNTLYRFVKDFSNTLLNREKGAFREVVAVPFPSQGQWAVGFVTGPVPAALDAADTEEKVLVFVMQAFSPATGFLLAVPRRSVVHLNMPVDEAFKLVLTGGMVKTAQATADPAQSIAVAKAV